MVICKTQSALFMKNEPVYISTIIKSIFLIAQRVWEFE